MQKPIPGNATGVKVTLAATDPSGKTQTIGTATTDLAGNYGISWTPSAEGQYQITATFEGSISYYSSFSTTYVVIGAAPAPSVQPTEAPTSTPTPTATNTPTVSPSTAPGPTEQPNTTMYVGISAAVIVVAIAAIAVYLRRRK